MHALAIQIVKHVRIIPGCDVQPCQLPCGAAGGECVTERVILG
jgi:hypothetical protein